MALGRWENNDFPDMGFRNVMLDKGKNVDTQVRDKFAEKLPEFKRRGIQMFLETAKAPPPFYTYREDPRLRGMALSAVIDSSDMTDIQVLKELDKTINAHLNRKRAVEERVFDRVEPWRSGWSRRAIGKTPRTACAAADYSRRAFIASATLASQRLASIHRRV